MITPDPNWTPGKACTGSWKEGVLRQLGQRYSLPTLIETGTCEGSTCLALKDDFTHIFTVELSPRYAKKSFLRLKDYHHIHLYEGSSPVMLPQMLSDAFVMDLPDTMLFWIDAHPSAPDGAHEGDPLAEELRFLVTTPGQKFSLFVIDDLQDASLTHVREAGVSLDGWRTHYFSGLTLLWHENAHRYDELATL